METQQQRMAVELERVIAAQPSRVWSIIASEEGMKSWLGPQNFEVKPGGRVLFDVSHDGTRWLMFGNIIALEENVRLSFSWQEFDTTTLVAWPHPTTVTVSLQAVEDGCSVRLSHSGFGKLPDAAEQLQGYISGWTSRDVLAGLAKLAEVA